jgi:hypothetical protein
VGPRRVGGSSPKGGKGLLIFAARWPFAAAGGRRSGHCCRRGFPPAPLQTARPSFSRDSLAIESQSHLGRGGGGGGGRGH